MRRRILIVIVVLVIAGAAAILYLLLSKQSSVSTTPSGTSGALPQTGTQSGTPGNAAGGTVVTFPGTGITGAGAAVKFGVVSNEPVFDYFVDAKNNALAIEPDGKIAYITNGEVSYLNSNTIQNLISADFSYDGAKVVVNFGDTTNPQTSVFDVAAKAWAPLPSGIISPVWSPIDYHLAYLEAATGTTTLFLIDGSKAGSKPTQLATFSAVDLSLRWIDKNRLMVYGKPSAYADPSAWIFNLTSKAVTPIISETPGLEITWMKAPTTTTGISFFSGQGGRGGSVHLINITGAVTKDLSFFTLASKCVFNFEAVAAVPSAVLATTTATSTAATPVSPAPVLALYCAVPRAGQDLLAFSHLPDDYEQMALFTLDDIYRIDTTNGALVDALAGQNIDVSDPKVFGAALFFVNRYDQKLYGLSLGTSTAAQ
ncbi:MAG: hypothetical protein ABSE18_00770 [Minisyncoccia bacterium]|jgi:hypothetical protein